MPIYQKTLVERLKEERDEARETLLSLKDELTLRDERDVAREERDEARQLLCEAIGLWACSEDWGQDFEEWWTAKKERHPWMEPRWSKPPGEEI